MKRDTLTLKLWQTGGKEPAQVQRTRKQGWYLVVSPANLGGQIPHLGGQVPHLGGQVQHLGGQLPHLKYKKKDHNKKMS